VERAALKVDGGDVVAFELGAPPGGLFPGKGKEGGREGGREEGRERMSNQRRKKAGKKKIKGEILE